MNQSERFIDYFKHKKKPPPVAKETLAYSKELLNYGWYHGSISRVVAEGLVTRPGEFLIRDSTSKSGDFVLSTMNPHTLEPIHFLISSKTMKEEHGSAPATLYCFEGQSFTSVRQFIEYHMKKEKYLTDSSMAILQKAIIRTTPLTSSPNITNDKKPIQKISSFQRRKSIETPQTSLPYVDRYGSLPRLNVKPKVVDNKEETKKMSVQRSGSDTVLTPTSKIEPFNYLNVPTQLSSAHSDTQLNSNPPPKPSRVPTIRRANRPVVEVRRLKEDDDDRDYSDYDTVKSEPSWKDEKERSEKNVAPNDVSKPNSVAVKPVVGRKQLAKLKGGFTATSQVGMSNTVPGLNNKESATGSLTGRNTTESSRPVIAARRPKEDDDDRDYSDYDTVKSEPSWMNETEHSEKKVTSYDVSKPNSVAVKPVVGRKQLAKIKGGFSSTSQAGKQGISDTVPKLISNEGATSQLAGSNTNDSRSEYHHSASVHRVGKDKKGAKIVLDSSMTNRLTKNISVLPRSKVSPDDDIYTEDLKTPTNQSNKEFEISDNQPYSDPYRSSSLEDISSFSSSLLPLDNKPLDPSVVVNIKAIILESNAKDIAEHITYLDVRLLKVTDEYDFGMCVTSGFEFITLPQGKKLREDLIERCDCFWLFIATTVLICGNPTERTRMIHKWIQVAVELKSSFGNLFSFVNVMNGLTCHQISRLRDTWMVLRQIHTGDAHYFDTNLRSLYKSLLNGSAALPLEDVTVPFIYPVITALDRSIDDIRENLSWETEDLGESLDVYFLHFDTARLICSQVNLYNTTSTRKLKDFHPNSRISDLCRVEFHMRFLFGSRGALADRGERYAKFDLLLTALSQRAEKPGDEGTEL